MSEECSICSEKYNNSTRKLVKCHCDFEFCKLCFKKYILSKKENPACMNCKIVYTRKFLAENLDKSFMTKSYKTLREELLFDQEIAVMPDTQLHIEKMRQIEKLRERQKILYEEARKLETEINTLQFGDRKGKQPVQKREFIRKCPNNDCNGFLSTSLKCGLCENWTCKNCREIIGQDKNTDHECDPEIVKNVEAIEKETKPCPKCGVPIFKINGCRSMFCIECDVSFDWNTLRIESGPIHNPEYFEKLRRTGRFTPRDPNDILCGRELDHNFIYILTQKLYFGPFRGTGCDHEYSEDNKNKECCKKSRKTGYYIGNNYVSSSKSFLYIDKVEQASEECIEFNSIGVQRLNKIRNTGNRDLRVEYLLNNITKEKFITEVQKRDKKMSMNDEIIEVYRVYRTCLTDILYRLYDNPNSAPEVINEITNLRKQINTFLCDIQKVYNSSCNLLVIKEN